MYRPGFALRDNLETLLGAIDDGALTFPHLPPARSLPSGHAREELLAYLDTMLMTGTRNAAAIGGITAAERLKVFPSLPKGGKYELVLEGALHSAFSDRSLPGDTGSRNPNHHRAILALSTAFWDAHLRGDNVARAWLEGAGPLSVLEKADQWRIN